MIQFIPHSFIALIILLLPLLSSAEDINLPSIGNDKSRRFSQAEEKILGESFMRQVRLELPVSDDPEVSDYIWHLGFRLIESSEFSSQHFHFFVVNDPNINAFAGPNGFIGVNAGLILNTSNESELASVMAHEIAHVTQRHLERSFDTGEKLSLPTAAAIITAIVLGSSANINLTEAAIFATIAANYQSQLNFSRAHELEADHIGIKILKNANFDPHGMPGFFEKLHQSTRLSESQVPEFLSTHPVTVNRIAESRNRASQYQYTPHPDNLTYFLTKAKLRVLLHDNKNALQTRVEAELKEGTYQNTLAQYYTYALTLLENAQFEKAREITAKLIKLDRERIQYALLQANIEIKAEQTEKGFAIFEDALKFNPGNAALSLHYADALLTSKQPEKAKQVLEEIQYFTPTPSYFQLRAKAEGDSGHPGASHQMLAEYYLLFDQIPIAINHLRQAMLEKDVDELEKQRIQTRIDEIKEIAVLEKQF